MEDWTTLDEEIIDEIPCVCGEGMQYKIRLVEVNLLSNEKRKQVLIKIECPNLDCLSIKNIK